MGFLILNKLGHMRAQKCVNQKYSISYHQKMSRSPVCYSPSAVFSIKDLFRKSTPALQNQTEGNCSFVMIAWTWLRNRSLLSKHLNVIIKLHMIKRQWPWLDHRKAYVNIPSLLRPSFEWPTYSSKSRIDTLVIIN